MREKCLSQERKARRQEVRREVTRGLSAFGAGVVPGIRCGMSNIKCGSLPGLLVDHVLEHGRRLLLQLLEDGEAEGAVLHSRVVGLARRLAVGGREVQSRPCCYASIRCPASVLCRLVSYGIRLFSRWLLLSGAYPVVGEESGGGTGGPRCRRRWCLTGSRARKGREGGRNRVSQVRL